MPWRSGALDWLASMEALLIGAVAFAALLPLWLGCRDRGARRALAIAGSAVATVATVTAACWPGERAAPRDRPLVLPDDGYVGSALTSSVGSS